MSYILGEHWCSNLTGTVAPTKYEVLWAREFRYDGSRQRYLNRELSAAALNTTPPAITPVSIVRSDYDGDDVYADWSEPIPGSTDPPVLLRSFEPGIGRVEPWTDAGGANTAYYHADMLGTTRMLTGANGQPLPGYGTASMPEPGTFTAFGERVSGPIDGASNRYGYVGEHGYQAHEEFSFLHLGARYYDPGLGRFLQRDPIGIRGGWNVYGYAKNRPSATADPSGLYSADDFFSDVQDVAGIAVGIGSAIIWQSPGAIKGVGAGLVCAGGILAGVGSAAHFAYRNGGTIGGAIHDALIEHDRYNNPSLYPPLPPPPPPVPLEIVHDPNRVEFIIRPKAG